MALALDTSTTSTLGTYSHTCTGSDLILFVGVNGDTTDTLTSITYNGVSMTIISKVQVPGDRWDYLYALVGPATGAHNVVISGASFHASAAVSYTGASQTGQPDSFNTGTVTGNTVITVSTTVVAANCWLIMWGSVDGGTMAAGTGTTFRNGSLAGGYAMFDSNGTVGTGSQSLQFNTGATNGNKAGVIASFKPVAPAGPANVKTFDGVTQSTGIQTYLGVAIASVKSVDGIT